MWDREGSCEFWVAYPFKESEGVRHSSLIMKSGNKLADVNRRS